MMREAVNLDNLDLNLLKTLHALLGDRHVTRAAGRVRLASSEFGTPVR